MKTKFLSFFILSFFLSAVTKSQTDTVDYPSDTIISPYAVITADTMAETYSNSDVNKQILPYHSPKKATLLSTFIPGSGQIYNKQAWKTPVIYAAFAGVTYFALTNNKNRRKFKDEYYNRINGNTEKLLADYTTYTDDGIYNLYNAYKSNFQLSIIVGVAFYALQILDAYVYGHLFNFDINDDISLNVNPYYCPMQNNSHFVGLTFNLNL